MSIKLSLEECFWKNVLKLNKNKCWIWLGYLGSDGYGRIQYNGRQYRAPRISVKLAGQNIENKIVRHKCDNPLCVNPNHLLVGTHADNVADRVKRNRSAKGFNHGRTKLTEKQIKFIRKSNKSNSALARQFKVDRCGIRRIREYKTWKHI